MTVALTRRSAAAALCLCGASAAHAGDQISVSNVSAAVYRGGSIQVDGTFQTVKSVGDPFILETDVATISASWTVSHQIVEAGPSWGLTISVPMSVSASVAASASSGIAEAFAGVAQFAFDVTFTGLPRIYTGAATLLDIDAEEFVFSGDTLAAGAYRLRIGFLSNMPTDVFVSASPGQSKTEMFTRVEAIDLTVIPAPASTLLLGAGLLALARRRR